MNMTSHSTMTTGMTIVQIEKVRAPCAFNFNSQRHTRLVNIGALKFR